MTRSVWVLAGALGVALIAAYASEFRVSERPAEDAVRVIDASPDAFESLRFTSASSEVVLARESDALGPWLEVTVTPDDGDSERFTGGSQADRVVELLVPLDAVRRLSDVSESRLESMGLASPETTFEVTADGRAHRFELGGRTYGGSHQYLRGDDGSVYLVDAGPLRSLEDPARRLPRRELIGLARPEIARVVVEAGEASVERVQKGRDPTARTRWVHDDDLARADEQFGNWIGRVLALRARGYVQPDEVPDDLRPVATLVFSGDMREETVELLRAGTEAFVADDPMAEEGPTYFARTDHTRALVRLGRQADEIYADLPGVVGSP